MKTINISEELHTKIKVYCAENKLKVKDFIEDELFLVIERYIWEKDTPEVRISMDNDIIKRLEENDTDKGIKY